MLDKAAYVVMNGATSSHQRLEILANNLANMNTAGFKSDFEVVKTHPIGVNGLQTRIYTSVGQTYSDFSKGMVLNTGRDLDMSIADKGFIAVQSKTGKEGYTRAGSLQLSNSGVLQTSNGEMVMGNGGVITIPPAERLAISEDGTISAILIGTKDLVVIDKIKLTNPNVKDLKKGTDGLFYPTNGQAVPPDRNVKIVTKTLEGSNVNAIEALTQIIDLSRDFEMHMNLIKNVAESATNANQLLSIVG